MPAGITATDGMMYTGETPWHGLGVKLDAPATSEEAIVAASMDWDVVTQLIYVQDGNGAYRLVPNKRAIVRQDTQEVFAVMGEGYMPTQNRTCWAMFDEVIAQGGAIYHTAGSLFGGRKIWILAKLPMDIRVGDETIEPFILLSSSHDGSQALRMQLTPVRVVCANTLSVALRGSGKNFYAKHTKNILNRASNARDILGLAEAYYEMFALQAERMAETRMTVVEVQEYLQKLYKFQSDKTYADQHHSKIKAYETTLDLLSHPTNVLGGMTGTAWAAYNAVTYYIDHERITGGGSDLRDDRRLNSTWFGSGAELRQTAYDLLVRAS